MTTAGNKRFDLDDFVTVPRRHLNRWLAMQDELAELRDGVEWLRAENERLREKRWASMEAERNRWRINRATLEDHIVRLGGEGALLRARVDVAAAISVLKREVK